MDADGRPELADLKTKKSRPRLELPALAVGALRRHRASAAALPTPRARVFTDTRGGPLRRQNLVTRKFRPLLARAGLERVPFHALRHTAATLHLSQGAHPKVVQEMLGHSTIAMTLDTYSHAVPSMQREAADRLGDALGGDAT